MQRLNELFKTVKPVIGMIHVGALPGTPKHSRSIQELVDAACEEAEIYKSCSVESVMLENMHDIPYVKPKAFSPEIVSAMTRIANEVKKVLNKDMPCGIQILAGGNKEAIAIAKACQLQFVRVEGFVFGHIGDEGYFDSCAGPLLRYRKQIDAESVLVFTDIKKKHSSHQITKDISIEETAKAAEFFLSDGIILTGTSTGAPADQNELLKLKSSVGLPIIIGSGVTKNNVQDYIAADAFIIGSYFKKDGRWESQLMKDRILGFMERINNLKGKH